MAKNTMKDEQITKDTYDLAIKAGFEDIPIRSGHYENDIFVYVYPTQSLLQRWLREKHGFHVQPLKTFHNRTYSIGKILVELRIVAPDVLDSYGNPLSYIGPVKGKLASYEQALESGLQFALKHINDRKTA